jgi:hypothetical protein
LQRNWFLEEIVGANARGLNCGVDRAVSRHHDDRHRQQARARPFLEQRNAIGIGHPYIEQHEIGASDAALCACLARIFGETHLVAFITQDFR